MKAKTKDAIKLTLQKWGLPILKESDLSVLFRYQMSYVQANITSGDETSAVALALCGAYSANDEKELTSALMACNHCNHHMLHVKLYMDADNDLVIASEFFYKETEDMEFLMQMGARTLISGKRRFLEKYNELQEEAALLSELEENE